MSCCILGVKVLATAVKAYGKWDLEIFCSLKAKPVWCLQLTFIGVLTDFVTSLALVAERRFYLLACFLLLRPFGLFVVSNL